MTAYQQTIGDILKSLGYADPMLAARQQARMILLGRLARYQAAIQQMESKWGVSLIEMSRRYEQETAENFAIDDDYLEWKWFADAAAVVESQLAALA